MITTPLFPRLIDNSIRKELVKCEQAAHYRYELGLQPIDDTRVDLVAGKAFARGMEVMRKAFYADHVSQADALNLGIAAVYASYGSFTPPAKSNKTADRMAGALAYYVQCCPLETEPIPPAWLDGKLAVECYFQFPIGIMHPDEPDVELEYCGNFDAIGLESETSAWVIDEKTTSQMGEKWANQWLLDSQMTGYCWGAQKMLDAAGMREVEVKGAIINGIAIRLRDYEHGRFLTQRQQWEVDRWYWQMKRDVTRWIEAYKNQAHDRVLDHACAMYNNPCAFANLCKSRNPERLLDGSFVIKRWNPAERD